MSIFFITKDSGPYHLQQPIVPFSQKFVTLIKNAKLIQPVGNRLFFVFRLLRARFLLIFPGNKIAPLPSRAEHKVSSGNIHSRCDRPRTAPLLLKQLGTACLHSGV